jgi:hypothetical protein
MLDVKIHLPANGLAGAALSSIRRLVRGGFAGMRRERAERHMRLIETLQLGGKRQLLLLVCDGRRYLAGTGGDSVQSIVEIPSAAQERVDSLGIEGSLPEQDIGSKQGWRFN